jgi:WD40 repeat protein
VIPKDNSRDPNKPPGPTFLAWTPTDRLFAGQPTGTISIWTNTMRPEAASNDHKAAVKSWAECVSSGDFATGDDKGNVALWSNKGGKPTVWPVFDGAPVTGLSFNTSGTRLAITDNTGWLVIWDATTGKAIHRVKRPVMPRAIAFGPTDDVMILSAGRTVEVWSLPELVK